MDKRTKLLLVLVVYQMLCQNFLMVCLLIRQRRKIVAKPRHKRWTRYDDWCQTFGNDRATGDQATTFQNTLHDVLQLDNDNQNEVFFRDTPSASHFEGGDDSVSETQTPCSKAIAGATSKLKKRKKSNDVDESLVEAIKDLAHTTKDTMANLIKEISAEEKISVYQDKAVAALNGIEELSEDDELRAAQLLFNNKNDLALFVRLGDKGRKSFVQKLLRGD